MGRFKLPIWLFADGEEIRARDPGNGGEPSHVVSQCTDGCSTRCRPDRHAVLNLVQYY
jgi:hypothetical protein